MANGITCYHCKRPHGSGKRETRPYGPGGAAVCAGCVFGEDDAPKNDARVAEAERQFGAALGRAGRAVRPGDAVAFGDEAGPRPHPLRRGRQ